MARVLVCLPNGTKAKVFDKLSDMADYIFWLSLNFQQKPVVCSLPNDAETAVDAAKRVAAKHKAPSTKPEAPSTSNEEQGELV